MPNTYVFQVARNQRILILAASVQRHLYLSAHAHMQNHVCLSTPPRVQLHRWIMRMSLSVELVLETLYVSLAPQCHS